MKTTVFICFSVGIAGPAAALTILPACSGQPMVGGFTVWDSWRVENGFVYYNGGDDDNGTGLAVLEHCKTGKALVADAVVGDADEAPDHLDNVMDAINDYVVTEKSYTMSQITKGLKARGIRARQATLSVESCACAEFYPDDRGSRKPFKN